MNRDLNEQMSALLDGELKRDEQDRVVSRMIEDDQAQLDRFGRYRLIGDIMRGESTVMAASMRSRVSQALADEPTVLAPRAAPPRWAKPAAGLAVAASVAVAAIAVAPSFLQQPEFADGGAVIASADAPQPPAPSPVLSMASPGALNVASSAPVNAQWQTLDADLGARLNRLVIEHHEFGGRTGINGPVSHIGLVNYAGR
jgi:sigma-E factor negative regulatory protein RseA